MDLYNGTPFPVITLRYFYFLSNFQCAGPFTSVDDIIDHYKKEQIVEGYNLKEPVSVQVTASQSAMFLTQLVIT